MTHARQQIRKDFLAALVVIIEHTFDSRIRPYYDDILPSVSCYTRQETIDDEKGGKSGQQYRDLQVNIQANIKAGNDIDDRLDEMAEQIEIAIFNDPVLKKLRCYDLISTETEINSESEKNIGVITLLFSCKYITKKGEPGVML